MLVLAARPRSCRSRKNSSNSPSARPAGLDVLPVQEDAARLEQVERLLVERAACARRAGGGWRGATRPRRRSPGRQPVAPAGVDEVAAHDLPAARLAGRGAARAAASIGSEKSTSTPVDSGNASRTSSAKPPSPAPRSQKRRTSRSPRVISRCTRSSCTSNSGISLRRSSMKPGDRRPPAARPASAAVAASCPLPDVHEVALDRRGGRHLRADQVRAPAAALAALEVAVRGRGAALAGLRGCPGSCPGTSSSRPRATRSPACLKSRSQALLLGLRLHLLGARARPSRARVAGDRAAARPPRRRRAGPRSASSCTSR